jgi:hypothetical protein
MIVLIIVVDMALAISKKEIILNSLPYQSESEQAFSPEEKCFSLP